MKVNKNIVNEPSANYEKSELDLIEAGLNRTYTERFEMMTKLMRMNIMLSKAVITHKPFIPKK